MTSYTRGLLIDVLKEQVRLSSEIQKLQDHNSDLLMALRMVADGIDIREYFRKRWDMVSLSRGGECVLIDALDNFKKSCNKK